MKSLVLIHYGSIPLKLQTWRRSRCTGSLATPRPHAGRNFRMNLILQFADFFALLPRLNVLPQFCFIPLVIAIVYATKRSHNSWTDCSPFPCLHKPSFSQTSYHIITTSSSRRLTVFGWTRGRLTFILMISLPAGYDSKVTVHTLKIIASEWYDL